MIVPVLLFAAAHYKRDIPFEIEKIQKQYPHITFSVVQPFSTHPHMVELVVKEYVKLCQCKVVVFYS